MSREVLEIPVLSAALRRIGAPVAVAVRVQGMVYTCGMPPLDLKTGEIVTGDIATQTRAALDALSFALDYAGSALSQVAEATIYLANNDLAPAMNAVYREYFPQGFPARTCVAIAGWQKFDIEIATIASVL